ncbi:MAG: diphosphomevalonate decarboxylase [Erysipelothrix sp.]|nr:diphosphomevalonate decarboxylase [Erysipelothrix sp.]
MKAKARAHANIALIKYWGKEDEELSIPNNSSLSLTLEAFYTETEVEFSELISEDEFYLDNRKDDITLLKVSKFLDLFRDRLNIKTRAIVKSINYVPTAAGLASSASAFAALAAAANKASGLNLNDKALSTFARKGSGSATRSIYGGIVEWQKGDSDQTSYAIEIDDANWDIGMVVVLVNSNEKKISSTKAMKQTVLTSPYYPSWVKDSEKDLIDIKAAIKDRDIRKIGEISERNALKMHATMLAAKPPIMYFEPNSILVIQIVQQLREKGIAAYFTMDAGPNVKILCKLSDANTIKEDLLKSFDKKDIIVTKVGPKVQII